MKPAIVKARSPAFSRRTIPVIERLETRTLLSVATHAAAVGVPSQVKARFPISDIFGAAAGIPIWQNGQPVLPGSAGPANSSAVATSSVASPLTGTGNGTLLGSATVPGGSSIFSLLPVLPPDGLAALIVGMLDPSNSTSAAIFNTSYGGLGAVGSHA
jgi:hypothetical protein